MYPTPYVASLRVFEPLEAFDPVDRLRWQTLPAQDNSREEEQRLALDAGRVAELRLIGEIGD